MTRQTKTMLNNLLLENYKQEHSIPLNSKLGTYGYWIATGYRPRKGEPSKHHCKLWTRNGLVNCWLWSEKQVDKMEAKFVGSVRDKNGYAVHLFYQYRGHEYMITAENNGYSETLREKHEQEQKRIDNAIAEQEKPKTGETFDLSVLDLLYQED